MHDIGTSIYSHAQGMVANTKLKPYNVMSPCFANDMSYLYHVILFCGILSLYVGFLSFVQTCLICTHLGGDAFLSHDMILLFANRSVVI